MLLNTSTAIFCPFQFPFDIKFDNLMQENYLQMPVNFSLVTTVWSALSVILVYPQLYPLIKAQLVSFLDQVTWSNFIIYYIYFYWALLLKKNLHIIYYLNIHK